MYNDNITMQAMADYTVELWESYPTDAEIEEMYTDAKVRVLAV